MSIIHVAEPPAEIRHVQLEEVKEFKQSDAETIRVYFVRHGESAFNVKQGGVKYVQGQSPQVPLTGKGEAQASKLMEQMLCRMNPSIKPFLVTSTAKRAIDTAKPLLEKLKLQGREDPAFLELGSGKWEGTSKEDPEYLKDYQIWKDLSANQKFSSPKVSTGESYSEVAFRALNRLSQISEELKENETIFVYGHHMLMSAVALSLTKTELSSEPGSALPEVDIQNGDLMLIEIPRGASADQGSVIQIIHSNLILQPL